MDGSTAVAALTRLSEARRDAAQTPPGNLELLPHPSSLRCCGGDQRQHPYADQPRTRLYEHALPATESSTHGRDQHRICRFSENQESRVECQFSPIPAESRI